MYISTSSKLIVFFIFPCFLFSCSGQRIYRKGMEAVEIGEYHKSTDNLRKAYRKVKDPNLRMQMAYDLGEAYRKLGEYNRAGIWYKNAIRRGYPDAKLNLLAAESLSAAQKFEEAKVYYEAYLAENPGNDYAETKLAYCDSVEIWQNSTSGYELKLLKQVNSREGDYAAFYSSARGNEIILSSMRKNEFGEKATSRITGQYLSQIYKSTYDLQRKRWNKVELINDGGAINTSDDNGAASISPSGDMLLFTRCEASEEQDMGVAIFSSDINRGNFAQATKLNFAPDSLIVAHPYFSITGDTVFFTSDRKGGYGNSDIWMSIRSNGEFGSPMNLGENINTPGDEIFPTTDLQGNLYFSTNYTPGLGGFDIFKASKDTSGNWMVTYMPIPINSSGDDLCMTFLPGSPYPQGLLTSNRKGSRKDDIYTFKLPPMELEMRGSVYNKDTQKTIDGAHVRVIATDGTDLRIRAADGLFKIKLKPENEYVFAAYKDYFLNDKIRISTIGLKQSESFTENLYLIPIDEPITVENINYEFGSAELTENSKIALDTAIYILNANPNITIELMSHTDQVGSDKSNSILSQQRAQSVVDYLISKGISGHRLVAKGYGETSPKQVNSRIAQEYDFLKKGDVLTPDFIDKLSENEQEIANSINRRTEFRVLSTNYQESLRE